MSIAQTIRNIATNYGLDYYDVIEILMGYCLAGKDLRARLNELDPSCAPLAAEALIKLIQDTDLNINGIVFDPDDLDVSTHATATKMSVGDLQDRAIESAIACKRFSLEVAQANRQAYRDITDKLPQLNTVQLQYVRRVVGSYYKDNRRFED